jgi:hypothetical protein
LKKREERRKRATRHAISSSLSLYSLSHHTVFVEALDKCFENVCELDLIFHSDKVRVIEGLKEET